MTTVVPERKFLVDGLHEALHQLQCELARAGRGDEFFRIFQEIVLHEADEAALGRILAEVKGAIAALERAETDTRTC
jgi:hypothetical protein